MTRLALRTLAAIVARIRSEVSLGNPSGISRYDTSWTTTASGMPATGGATYCTCRDPRAVLACPDRQLERDAQQP